MRTILLLLMVSLICSRQVYSFTISADSSKTSADSLLSIDNQPKKDTIVKLPLFEPLRNHGALFLLPDTSFDRVEKQDFQLLNYTGMLDVIDAKIPLFQLTQGYYGMMSNVSVYGGSAHDNTLMFNGHSVNDIPTGLMYLEQFPVEFTDGAEVVTGMNAVILAGSASGVATNLREVRFNTKTPFTRIWYTQGGYGFGGSNGILSQNISSNMNATVGYRRLGADGRYSNQWLDAWNVYGLLRWNLNEKTNVSYTHIFTNYATGLNGGVDPRTTTDIGDEVTANVRYTDLSERIYKHQGTLLLTQALAADTTSIFSASVYGENTIHKKERDTLLYVNNTDTLRTATITNYRFGGSIRYDQVLLGGLTLRAGGNAEFRSINTSQYNESFDGLALTGHILLNYELDSHLKSRVGLRYNSIGQTVAIPSIGGALEFTSSIFTLIVDASQSDRLPTVTEGLGLLPEHHTLAFAKLQVHLPEQTTTSLTAFVRYVDNPIIPIPEYVDTTLLVKNTTFSNQTNKQVFGGILEANTLWNSFVIKGNLLSSIQYINNQKEQLYPALLANVQARYEYKTGTSLLYAGISLQARTGFQGEWFIPINWSYAKADVTHSAAYNGIDLLAGAKLGNAFIKVTFQNILGTRYTTLSTFPQNDRNLRLSVAWSFFD